jgi:hypothetical protein
MTDRLSLVLTPVKSRWTIPLSTTKRIISIIMYLENEELFASFRDKAWKTKGFDSKRSKGLSLLGNSVTLT